MHVQVRSDSLRVKYFYEYCLLFRYGTEMPFYIDLVRDPINRVISIFYHRDLIRQLQRLKPDSVTMLTVETSGHRRYVNSYHDIIK